MSSPLEKLEALKALLRESGGVAIAFSGGVDSTFLASVAREVLGERALAVTAISPVYPRREQIEAARLARLIGIRHAQVESDVLATPHFAENSPNRCYYCKSELFRTLMTAALRCGIGLVADGSNADDAADYRPGSQAAREHGIVSPLQKAGLTKRDIRDLSRQRGLPTADKAAFACLATRIPYGTAITAGKLAAVEAVEDELCALGFRQYRVRHHGDMARIEVEPDEIERACRPDVRERLARACRKAGFLFASLDMEGYRTGSMNRALPNNAAPLSEI